MMIKMSQVKLTMKKNALIVFTIFTAREEVEFPLFNRKNNRFNTIKLWLMSTKTMRKLMKLRLLNAGFQMMRMLRVISKMLKDSKLNENTSTIKILLSLTIANNLMSTIL
jgi:hypothetical protein